MTQATGVGSWPGTDVRDALATVRDLLASLDEDGVTGLPYLPELPGRGPGGDLVGRGAGLLVELPVDLQPAGWRLVDRPGRDLARTQAFWRQDLDELAEAFDGYAGPLKIQAAGPWTLAGSLWLARGERAVVDEGACRDLVASLAEGVHRLVGDVGRLVPQASVVLQLDEPSLPALLQGQVPTASGLGRLSALDPQQAGSGLRSVLEHARAAGARHTVVHCCAPLVPMPLLRDVGAGGIGVDTATLTPRAWEGLAVAAEDGMSLCLGCVPAGGATAEPAERIASALVESWQRLGMPASALREVAVSPSCGLAGLSIEQARQRQALVIEVARYLQDAAER